MVRYHVAHPAVPRERVVALNPGTQARCIIAPHGDAYVECVLADGDPFLVCRALGEDGQGLGLATAGCFRFKFSMTALDSTRSAVLMPWTDCVLYFCCHEEPVALDLTHSFLDSVLAETGAVSLPGPARTTASDYRAGPAVVAGGGFFLLHDTYAKGTRHHEFQAAVVARTTHVWPDWHVLGPLSMVDVVDFAVAQCGGGEGGPNFLEVNGLPDVRDAKIIAHATAGPRPDLLLGYIQTSTSGSAPAEAVVRRIQLIEERRSGPSQPGEKAMAFDTAVDMHLRPSGATSRGVAGLQPALAGWLAEKLVREAVNFMEPLPFEEERIYEEMRVSQVKAEEKVAKGGKKKGGDHPPSPEAPHHSGSAASTDNLASCPAWPEGTAEPLRSGTVMAKERRKAREERAMRSG